MKVYAKNSFDRFGDDLTQLILQHLTFEDKIRLECVSKQWRRLVFNKQFGIEIYNKLYPCLNEKNSLQEIYRRIDNKKQIDEHSVESVLKKCPNIQKVIIWVEVSSKVMSIFGQYCPYIKSLSLLNDCRIGINSLFDSNKCLDFFVNNGHKLEELIIQEFNDNSGIIGRQLESEKFSNCVRI